MPYIRFIKTDKKYRVYVTGKGGERRVYLVDDLVFDEAYEMTLGRTGGSLIVPDIIECKVVEVALRGIKEKVFVCGRKTINELRRIIRIRHV